MIEILGWAGALVLLAGYALLSLGRIPNSGRYQVLNVVGSAGLAANGLVHGAWPSVVLNVVWVAIGAVALTRLSVTAAAHPRRARVGAQPPTAERDDSAGGGARRSRKAASRARQA